MSGAYRNCSGSWASSSLTRPKWICPQILSQVGADTELLEAHMEGMAELARERDLALEDTEIDHGRKLEDIAREKQRAEEEERTAHLNKLAQIDQDHRVKMQEAEIAYRLAEEQRELEYRLRKDEMELLYRQQEADRLGAHELKKVGIQERWQAEDTKIQTEFVDAWLESENEFIEDKKELKDEAEADELEAQGLHNEAVEKLATEFRTQELEDAKQFWTDLHEISEEWAEKVSTIVRETLEKALRLVEQLESMVASFTGAGGIAGIGGGGAQMGMAGPGATAAEGAFVTGPTLLLAGEAGPEAIIPLPDLEEMVGNVGLRGEEPPIQVYLGADLERLGDFVRAQVLRGNIRGRQEVFYR